MKLAFDLISDLHIETWEGSFDWTGQSTSMICVVAGDIARDRDIVIKTLTHLGQCYRAVFYIDGNDEHRFSLDDMGESYRSLAKQIEQIPNVTYLQDNVCIVDGVAFLGTNAWWTFDLDSEIDYDQSRQWFRERYQINEPEVNNVEAMAFNDYAYLAKSVERLQTHRDVKKIVLVTHTVPSLQLIDHDLELAGTYRLNCTGNSHILKVFQNDTERKISTWCFGHYHNDVDHEIAGVRFVNNCRGRRGTAWSKSVYYPKRIEVTL
jgi:predicted phosphodiesterase